jgi:MFS family permease
MNKPHAPVAPTAADSRWRSLLAAIACVIIFDVTLGFSFPVLTLLLEARGTDDTLIGFNAAMTPLGLLVAGPFIPALAHRFGARAVAVVCAVAVTVMLLAIKTFDSLAAWFVLRFALGASTGALFAISESWVVRFSEGPNRAMILAVYASLLAAGFAIGPFMIPFTGIHGWAPFLIAAAFSIAAIIPIPFVVIPPDTPEEAAEGHRGFLAFLPMAPVLLCAVGVFAIMDAATMSFLPLYGMREGLDLDTASIALGVLIAGNVFVQVPIGWLADRWSKPGMMIVCALVTAGAAALIPATIGSFWMWPVFVLFGAMGFGVYTVALALLGDRFSGSTLVAGAAAFATMWGLGAVIGAPAASNAMKYFGNDALPVFLCVLYLIYGLAFWRRHVTRHAVPVRVRS